MLQTVQHGGVARGFLRGNAEMCRALGKIKGY